MGNCHPKKTNVDRGEAEVDIGFRGVTICHITLKTPETQSVTLFWLD